MSHQPITRNNLAFYDQQAPHWWDAAATIAPLNQLNPLRFNYFDQKALQWAGQRVLDVLENVADPQQAIGEISRVLKPGGLFCFDTINRTLRSRLIMIWLLEDLLRQIPRGIHDWHKFITPAELTHLLAQHHFQVIQIDGFNLFGSTIAEHLSAYRYYQATGQFRARFDADTRVMYIGTTIKAESKKGVST